MCRLTAIVSCLLCLHLLPAADEAEVAAQALRAKLPQVRVSLDHQFGVARHITTTHGLLTGAGGVGPAVARAVAVGEDRAVRGFLDTWPALFGGGSEILADAVVVRDDLTSHNGLHTRVWQQVMHGIPVHQARLVARTLKGDQLVSLGSRFVPHLRAVAPAKRQAVAHGAVDAVTAALLALGGGNAEAQALSDALGEEQRQRFRIIGAKGEVIAKLRWVARTPAELRLAWAITLTTTRDGVMHLVLIDATDLSELGRERLTSPGFASAKEIAAARARVAADGTVSMAPVANTTASLGPTSIAMRVYPSDSPQPFTPGRTSTGDTTVPAVVSRTLVTLASVDATASPNGWIGDPATNRTQGDNVRAYLDRNDDNTPASGDYATASGSPPAFDFPLDLTKAPSTYGNAAVTNLFYWCNVAHDRLYTYGFTESAGNFQGNDPVLAEAQDGASIIVNGSIDEYHRDNANFSLSDDGESARMQMYLWTGANPDRDGALDATVILHEYGHGVSNRLVGGGDYANLDDTQSGGMGEGWSDFIALSLLSETGDDPLGTYAVGTYVTRDYFAGVRARPYCVEPGPVVRADSTNPFTFADITGTTGFDVHFIGTVWCQMLWECRGELIAAHGATTGNQLMLQLVIDGMKLTPLNPSFTEARDGILQADQVSNAGANQQRLWRAFAKRGLGPGAVAGDADQTSGIAESFDYSPDFRVSNAAGVRAYGPPGGGFTLVGDSFFVLRNTSGASLDWSASANQGWIALSATSGTLTAGASTTITTTLTAQANSLGEGLAFALINFRDVTDVTNAVAVTRPAQVLVRTGYTISSEAMSWVDTASQSGLTTVSLADDAYSSAIALPAGFAFNFYGTDRSSIRIGSNGLIGFGAEAGLNQPLNAALPNRAAPNDLAAPWWDDLNPAAAGSIVHGTTGSAPSRRFIVTWQGVPHYERNTANPFTFQLILEEDTDDLIFQYQQARPTDGEYGSGRSATIGVEDSSGLFATQHSSNTASVGNGTRLRFQRAGDALIAANATPTVAQPVSALVAADGLSASISVLGADDGAGESALIYQWGLAGIGSPTVSFATNGTNGAKATTMAFSQVGVHQLSVWIIDPGGKAVLDDADVTVPAVWSGITVSAADEVVAASAPLTFSAGRLDQFGFALAGTPSVTWQVIAGSGSITSDGVFTGTAPGPATIQATATTTVGVRTASATITVLNDPPTVATPAAATPTTVADTDTNLAVLGGYGGGESLLVYTWTALGTPPAPVGFSANSTNAAKNTTATFAAAGSYTLRATISDPGSRTATSDVTVTVVQTPTGLAIDPQTATIAPNASRTFIARDGDQFGDPISGTTRTVTWATSAGSITNGGVFTAPGSTGDVTITATATTGGQSDDVVVTVASGGGAGGSGGGGGGSSCNVGPVSALLGLLLLSGWRRRRLGDG